LHIWPQPHAQNPSAGSSTSTSAFDTKSCSVRYWARPKTYKHARYAFHIDPLLSAPPREIKFLFRMSHPEYLRLVLRFGQGVVFQARSKRQPADPKYQLALFIYRLAHGISVSARGSKRRHTHDVCFSIISGALGSIINDPLPLTIAGTLFPI